MHHCRNGYISFKGAIIMSCPLSFLQKNARNLLNDASDVWKCNQQFAQFWNSRRPPFYILLFSYLFFTLFLWASSCKLSIRFLLFFLFFLWYFQLLFFLPVRLGPLLFVSSYTLSATLLHHPLQPRQFCSFHTISRYVCVCCVCVCVCVCCVCARGAACCSLLLGAMFDDAMLLNKSVLTVLCCQPCLWRVASKGVK